MSPKVCAVLGPGEPEGQGTHFTRAPFKTSGPFVLAASDPSVSAQTLFPLGPPARLQSCLRKLVLYLGACLLPGPRVQTSNVTGEAGRL